MFELIIISYNSINDFSSLFYYQAWNVEKSINESFIFHPHDPVAQNSVRHEPAIPCQRGYDHICPIGIQAI